MECIICGGVVNWQGDIGSHTHTKCKSCGALNSQIYDSNTEFVPNDNQNAINLVVDSRNCAWAAVKNKIMSVLIEKYNDRKSLYGMAIRKIVSVVVCDTLDLLIENQTAVYLLLNDINDMAVRKIINVLEAIDAQANSEELAGKIIKELSN